MSVLDTPARMERKGLERTLARGQGDADLVSLGRLAIRSHRVSFEVSTKQRDGERALAPYPKSLSLL